MITYPVFSYFPRQYLAHNKSLSFTVLSRSLMSDSVQSHTVACQAPLSMGFFRQECWNWLPCPSPRDLPNPGLNPGSIPHCRWILYQLIYQGSPQWEPIYIYIQTQRKRLSMHTCTHVSLLSPVWLFCGPINWSPLGSSFHGISQVRLLEWDAIAFSRGSSQPMDWTCISYR